MRHALSATQLRHRTGDVGSSDERHGSDVNNQIRSSRRAPEGGTLA